jgi:peroxiredoxin
LRLTVILLWASILGGLYAQPTQTAGIGSAIDNLQLPDASGTSRTLRSYSGKVVVFVFWSYKCPVALAYNDRIEALRKKYAGRGVEVFGVSSGANESPSEIRANLDNLNITMPVLLDSEGKLAEQLGATHTPGVFILDRSGVLRYRGALDNNKKVGDNERQAYAEDAIDAVLGGRAVAVPETRPFGCTIRRKIF